MSTALVSGVLLPCCLLLAGRRRRCVEAEPAPAGVLGQRWETQAPSTAAVGRGSRGRARASWGSFCATF